MNKKIVFLVCCWLLAGMGATLRAQDKKQTDSTVTTPEKKDSVPPPSSYEKLLKDATKEARGLMNLYYVKKKLYLEIPLPLMGREMLLASTISEISDNFDGIVGSKPKSPLEVSFSLVDSSVLLRKIDEDMIAPQADGNIREALAKNSIGAIVKIFDVAAWNPAHTAAVIDITDYFLSDIKELSPFDGFSVYASQGLKSSESFKKDRSFIGDIKAFENNVVIKSYLSYENTITKGTAVYAKNKPFTAVMTRTLLLLPEKPVRPRIADPRIGIFNTSKTMFSGEVNRTEKVYYARRWNLVPKDVAAYNRGELTEPVQPIVFYIDTDFPESWKPAIREAVTDWEEVFEKTGFKNAILVKDYPASDSSFDPDDLTYNCIRYAPTPVANAVGPSWIDPRSGEIINASVYVFHDVIRLLNNWMFIQTAPADKKVRHTELPEAYKEAGLKYVVRHEVGHCLGLMHNMGASSAIPVDSLRSPTFTKQYGTTYSIMDYARFNYVAQPGDKERGVQLTPPRFGLYDYYAIEWNYRYYDSTVSDDQQKEALDRLVSSKAGDIRYKYGAQQGLPFDPSAQNEDLGDDAMKASAYGVANLKYIMQHLNDWVGKEDKDYSYRQEIWSGILSQYVRYINHVYANIGGIYLNERYVGDPRPFYQSVPREKQEAAMKFITQAMNDLDWLETPEVLQNLPLTGTPATLLRRQIIEALLQAPLKVNLAALKSRESQPYTSRQAMKDIYAAVWAPTIAGQEPTAAEKDLQKAYVETIIKNAKLLPTSGGSPASLASDDRFLIQLPNAYEHDLSTCGCEHPHTHTTGIDNAPISGFGAGAVNFNLQPALEDLYYVDLMASRSLLEANVHTTTNQETLMHYKLLLFQIDKALK